MYLYGSSDMLNTSNVHGTGKLNWNAVHELQIYAIVSGDFAETARSSKYGKANFNSVFAAIFLVPVYKNSSNYMCKVLQIPHILINHGSCG